MSPEYILKASIKAMIKGHRAPHCFRAWVRGKGYVNNGSLEEDRADYLRQLEQSATSELENLGYSSKYAEPGYEQPKNGILFANWNVFPSEIDMLLERAGYAVEWFDEWDMCDDCNSAFRIEPDGLRWTPYYHTGEDATRLCLACYKPEEE